MLFHIVLFRWRADASAFAIQDALDTMRTAEIYDPNIAQLSIGEETTHSPATHGFTHGVVLKFENRASLDAWLNGRALERIKGFCGPLLAETLSVDLAV